MPHLIGLYSPAPQSGKTEIARHLMLDGYMQVSFAAPLKSLVHELLCQLGHDNRTATSYVHAHKEQQIPGIRCSARHLMQTLGTEWGRQCVHPDVWVMIASKRISALHAAGHSVVIDDCRFPNEASLIRELGGELWHVERPDATTSTDHASEGALTDPELFTHRIVNDGTLQQLREQVAARLHRVV
jgi:hypothetical protein